MLLLQFVLQCHQLLVPDFALISLVLWGAQTSAESVIFEDIVAMGAYWGAPAWLHCLKEQGKTAGRKWPEKRDTGYWQAMHSASHSWLCTLHEKGSTGDRGHNADMLACLHCFIFVLVMLVLISHSNCWHVKSAFLLQHKKWPAYFQHNRLCLGVWVFVIVKLEACNKDRLRGWQVQTVRSADARGEKRRGGLDLWRRGWSWKWGTRKMGGGLPISQLVANYRGQVECSHGVDLNHTSSQWMAQ